MNATIKRVGIALLAIVFAASMTAVFAASPAALADDETAAPAAVENAISSSSQAADADGAAPDQQPAADSTAPAADCSLTLTYTSDPTGDEAPGTEFDDGGRVILGTRTITGLQEGQTISAWDYVVNIPGHFFFDAWPAQVTISADPAQNAFTFVYLKLWDYEYTVNYYLMTGADLSADNWKDALAPEDVGFYKMGSETFDNQQFNTLVEGDAYEYKLDGTYVIDTYPAEIRVGTDADDNVINVLYTPDSQNLPDDMEVPDDMTTPPAGTQPTPPATLPGDTTLDKDDTATLPDDFTTTDKVEITDEMLDHPVSKQQAELTKNAYLTGVQEGSALVQTGDGNAAIIITLVVAAAVAIGVIAYVLYRRNHKPQA